MVCADGCSYAPLLCTHFASLPSISTEKQSSFVQQLHLAAGGESLRFSEATLYLEPRGKVTALIRSWDSPKMKIYSQCHQCKRPFQERFSTSRTCWARHAGAYAVLLQHQLPAGSAVCCEAACLQHSPQQQALVPRSSP